MFSCPKILFLVSLLFVALLNPKFNPYLLFKFLIFYHSSVCSIAISPLLLLFHLQVFCTGVLIAAAIALSAINEVDDIANERSGEYEDADSYRGAAGWLVFVGCAAIVFDVVMISIQILYFKCTVKKYFTQYSIIVSG